MPASHLKRFHHVGIAVRDVDAALALYRDVLGARVTTYKHISYDRKFTYTHLRLGGQLFELIEPVKGVESFLTRFLSRHGEGLHHLTFRVSDIRKTLEHLKAKGVRVTDVSFEDPTWLTAFISPRSASGVLVQVTETDL